MRKRAKTNFKINKNRLIALIVVTFAAGLALVAVSIVLLSSGKTELDVALATPQPTATAFPTVEKAELTPTAEESLPIVTTPPEDDPVFFARESKKINDDVIGWIRIEGTPVDYPVVQAADDVYYLTRDAEKNENVKGAIFLDYHCDPVSLKGNNILYGHHMKDGSMFAALVEYEDENYFNSHPVIKFASLERTYDWEIFAVLITDPSYDYLQTEFTDEDQYLGFITAMQEKSLIETDIKLSGSDDILVLSTCTYDYDDARFVVAARRIP